jgi:hypothetical protein
MAKDGNLVNGKHGNTSPILLILAVVQLWVRHAHLVLAGRQGSTRKPHLQCVLRSSSVAG